jgi:hypothetical protein
MTKIKVVDRKTSHVTKERDPSDEGDRDSTDTDHNIVGIYESKDYGDVEVGFKLDKNKRYYLLYVNYDTGDSFGRDGGQISFINLFENEEKANENRRRIEEHYKKFKDSRDYNVYGEKLQESHYSVRLVAENGEEYMYSPEWMGYFEDMNSVDVDAVKVVEKTLRRI